VEVREYLRDEFLEEAGAGFYSQEELARRLALFDGGIAQKIGEKVKNMAGDSSATPASVPEDDATLTGEDRTIDTSAGPLDIYVARPKDAGDHPGIVLIHENQGLVPHIRDVARRLAKLGYVVVAPDLLTPAGGVASFGDAPERIAALGTLDREQMVVQLVAAVDELVGLSGVDANRIGAIGFCFGGGMTWLLSTREPRLKAAVPFYGPNPPLDQVPNIQAAVLAVYGANDERINAGIADIESAMSAAGKSFEKEVYDGAGHAFHNDSNPDRYNEAAATRAWSRATSFLQQHLNS
jgi:carboxymethylenebutenolidase